MEVPLNSHHQAMNSHQLAEVLGMPKIQQQQQQQERKPRPQADQSLKCPRCASTNTKFCYYNNYSLSQPRYFCKGCRRYWTQGGSLRNVPVGGGCRKNKRSSSSSSASNSTISTAPNNKTSAHHQSVITTPPNMTSPNPNPSPVMLHSLIAPSLSYDANDLTLAFSGLQKQQHSLDSHHSILLGHANNSAAAETSNIPTYGFLDILKSGFMENAGATPSGLNNLYYGFGASNNSVDIGAAGSGVSSEEQGNSSCKGLDEGETKMLMGLQWQDGNLALDSSGRDYWSSGSNWHGLINSSLI